MSNNVVMMQGYFEVERVEQMEVGGRVVLVIRAWLHTGKVWEGGRHPLLISGRPAEIVLEMARHGNGAVEAVVNGRLLSRGERSWVEVKRITFLGIPQGGARVPTGEPLVRAGR